MTERTVRQLRAGKGALLIAAGCRALSAAHAQASEAAGGGTAGAWSKQNGARRAG